MFSLSLKIDNALNMSDMKYRNNNVKLRIFKCEIICLTLNSN